MAHFLLRPERLPGADDQKPRLPPPWVCPLEEVWVEELWEEPPEEWLLEEGGGRLRRVT